MQAILGTVIRHGLTILGGAGMATDDIVTQIVGLLMTAGGVAASLYKAYKAK